MYYKIRDNILFRQYARYGYITDNSEYGYRMLSNVDHHPGEKFISESGAYMLAQLEKKPKHIDEVIINLMSIFEGVSFEELKRDTIELFDILVQEGYLSCGETCEKCQNQVVMSINDETVDLSDNTEDNPIRPNDLLRSIHIEIASACNERCIHCYIPHEYKNQTMDPDLFFRIVEEGRKMNIIHVTLSGGEPLMHRDIIHFLKKCRELDLSVNVLSNLTLLTDEIMDEMKKNKLLSVQTSLYSMNADEHDAITKQNGSFVKTRDALLKLLALGIPLQISCPIMKENKRSFNDVIQWGSELGIPVVIEPQIFGSYDHSGRNLEHRLSVFEIGEVTDLRMNNGETENFISIAREKEKLSGEDPICSVCRYSFCVSVTGEIYPCAGWQTNVIGDINKQSLQDIWENSEKVKRLRSIKRKQFPRCVTCKDRGYCTVCMMNNANESPEGDAFCINEFHCQAAAAMHDHVNNFIFKKSD